MKEPILRSEDHEAWDILTRTARVHASTQRYARSVDRARRLVCTALEKADEWAVMWSGGKDSTAMTALALSIHPSLELVSEKDDLDYPGEREYVEALARRWGANLRIVTPDVSPAAWMAEHGHEHAADDDMHGRNAALSKACFYQVVEQATTGRPVFLGLRKDESRHRMLNRTCNGTLYCKRSGQWVCTPLADWSGLDVFAYLLERGIEPVDVYRCIGLMHRDEPWRVRKSWWIPGASGRFGGVAWLRHYYPSLYQKLCSWVPMSRVLT